MSKKPVEREVVAEHRRLDGLFAAVRAGFVAMRQAQELPTRLRELCEALEKHFLQEEKLHYPALTGLSSEQRARLEACVAVHAQFRESMNDLNARATGGELAGAGRVFEALAEDFRRHEVREEEVLRELGGELPEAR
jgi:hypothetical protein